MHGVLLSCNSAAGFRRLVLLSPQNYQLLYILASIHFTLRIPCVAVHAIQCCSNPQRQQFRDAGSWRQSQKWDNSRNNCMPKSALSVGKTPGQSQKWTNQQSQRIQLPKSAATSLMVQKCLQSLGNIGYPVHQTLIISFVPTSAHCTALPNQTA